MAISLTKLIQFIERLLRNGFYGKIIICFESGKIIRIVQEESIKEL